MKKIKMSDKTKNIFEKVLKGLRIFCIVSLIVLACVGLVKGCVSCSKEHNNSENTSLYFERDLKSLHLNTNHNVDIVSNSLSISDNNEFMAIYPMSSFSIPLSYVSNNVKIISFDNDSYIYFREISTFHYELDFVTLDINNENIRYALAQYQYNSTTYKWTYEIPSGVSYYHCIIYYNSSVIPVSIASTSPTQPVSNYVFGVGVNGWNSTLNKYIGNKSIFLSNGALSSYQSGYDDGFSFGKVDGINQVLYNLDDYDLYTKDEYLNYGLEKENQGYTNGVNTGSKPLLQLFDACLSSPVNFFKDMFDFEILGVNISGFLIGLLSVLIFAWLLTKFI